MTYELACWIAYELGFWGTAALLLFAMVHLSQGRSDGGGV